MDRQRVQAGRAVVVGHGPPGDLAGDVRGRAVEVALDGLEQDVGRQGRRHVDLVVAGRLDGPLRHDQTWILLGMAGGGAEEKGGTQSE